MLKLPAKRGLTWEVPVRNGSGKRVGSGGSKTVVGEEEVATPAGKFMAVRVEFGPGEGVQPWSTEWWAPGRGKVKDDNGGSGIVLKSFSPGK